MKVFAYSTLAIAWITVFIKNFIAPVPYPVIIIESLALGVALAYFGHELIKRYRNWKNHEWIDDGNE